MAICEMGTLAASRPTQVSAYNGGKVGIPRLPVRSQRPSLSAKPWERPVAGVQAFHAYGCHWLRRRSGEDSGSLTVCYSSGNGGGPVGGGSGGGGNGGNSGGGKGDSSNEGFSNVPLLGGLVRGWHKRVSVDPQFPYKVLMEELVGVSSCVIGDMSVRPNWGLNELDFVFSTLVVSSIINFVLMYMLAPTGVGGAALPGIFAACPAGHMFEAGAYSLAARAGTLLYKAIQFGGVGVIGGVGGTLLTNALVDARKRVDKTFVANENPPVHLNALSWAIHMAFSSNIRYQMLNGIDGALVKMMPPTLFKLWIPFIRCLNNVAGGVTFSLTARAVGAQKSSAS